MSLGWGRRGVVAVLFGWAGIAVAQRAETNAASAPVRVSSGTLMGQILKRVDPFCPPNAVALHVHGAVVLRILISTTGEVEAIQPVGGPPILVGVMMDAVEQWRYRPYTLNGKAVEVETTITLVDQCSGYASASTAAGAGEEAARAEVAVPPVRVSAGTMAGLLISKADAVLPAEIASQVKGPELVVLEALISRVGDVVDVREVSEDSALAKYTIDAVRQWKYKPYVLDGKPVEVKTTIRVDYLLGGEGYLRMIVLRQVRPYPWPTPAL